ncbi:MAG: heparan N-sulfatase [Verrucomicrobia bacterium]|nr:MAG: heparan N-sulfatase [Verrucomicrobiota bacterium]
MEEGKLVRRVPGFPNEYGTASGHWTAYLDDNDWGVGILTPGTPEFTSYRYEGSGETGPEGIACSYVAPVRTLKLTKGLVLEHDVYLTIGTLEEIRERFSKVQERPNVVLIIGDDISWNDFGCYGNSGIRTPNIDRLAGNGMRFDNAFLTASSCSPSRCSIIAGRYPHNTGAAELHTSLPGDQIPFPLRLKENGYYCAQGGKWHMGEETKRAFDEVRGGRGGDDPGAEGEWLPLLKNRPMDRPFFMWFASVDAHRGWDGKTSLKHHDPAKVQVPKYLVDTQDTRQDLANYYDEIARLDYYVGEIEKELEQQGIAEKTIIIFMADNGRPFPRCKTRVYDSGMKTPFIVKWPKGIKKAGRSCDSLVSAIDIAPTILEWCGIPVEDSFQGRSFASLLENPEQPFRRFVFSEHNWHDHEALERMVRSKDYLYVVNDRPRFANCGPADSNRSDSQRDLNSRVDSGELTPEQKDIFLAPRPREELFDLKTDPEQFRNVAADPDHAEALREIRRVMQRWRKETADTSPDNLTPDWYTRFTGLPLDIERTRGEMPGAAKSAEKVNAKGPF